MRTSVNMTKTEYENLAELYYTLRLFLRFSAVNAREFGLTSQQFQAVLAVKRFTGHQQITVGILADCMQIKHHSAVGLVDRLVAENLILRSPAPDDHRKVLLSLTEHGNSTLEKLARHNREELHQLSAQLSLLLERINKS